MLDELRAGDPPEPAVRVIEEADWLEVVPVPNVADPIRSWELGAGEASVLTWVRERSGAVAVLDGHFGDLESERSRRRTATTSRGKSSISGSPVSTGALSSRPVATANASAYDSG